MNNGIYRLVFNASRGLWMAVSEHVRSHQSGKNCAKTSKRKQTKQRATLYIILLGLSATSALNTALADAILPVNTIPTGLQVTSGNIAIQAPIVNPANINGQLLNINQSSLKGIMQGTNFNIGRASGVNLNHTAGSGSATLIRINGPKSVIEGALNAPNGRVFLINQNGILFGDGARVNVGGLVASALNMQDNDFLSDLGDFNAINDGLRPAYVWGGDGAGFQEVLVQVEPDANIKAALGGSVMLFAPKVINQGSIETTDGQVVMAGGDKVYLSVAPQLVDATRGNGYVYAKDSPYRALAGVLVEVDSYKKKGTDLDAVPTEITGEVVNDTMGRILAQRGNITMAGFMVNQNGRATATSSVNQKGSIRLLARDTFDQSNVLNPIDGRQNLAVEKTTTEPVAKLVNGLLPDGSAPLTYTELLTEQGAQLRSKEIYIGSRTGKLNIGKDSITTVLAEDKAALSKALETFATPQVGEPLAKAGEKSYVTKVLEAVNVKSGTVTEDQIFSAPIIEAVGRQVTIGDNAKIVAPGGFVNVSAQINGAGFNYANFASFDPESRLFMGNNTLIDVAGLKNVSIDMERNFVELLLTQTDLKDDPLNKNGFLNRKRVWFDIRNTPDSKVADLDGFVAQVPRSLGEKLTKAGSVKIQSEGDLIQNSSSKIDVSGGSLLYKSGINKETWLVAQSGKTYRLGEAPVDTVFTGFLGGKNSFETPEAGYVEGKAAGSLEVNAVNLALDGQLNGGATYGERQRESANLGGKLAVSLLTPQAQVGTTRDMNISNTSPAETNFAVGDALPESRKSEVEINATMLNRSGFEDIALNTSGAVKVNADLNLANGAKFTTSNGSLKANEINKNITARGGKIDVGLTKIADGVTINASGNWVNDTISARSNRVLINGGDVKFTLAEEMGNNTLVDVSGGAWLQNNRKIVNGNAGSIAIDTQNFSNNLLSSDVELRGYALGVGGNLTISANNLTIGDTAIGKPNEALFTPEFFQTGGFTSYQLNGGNDVVVRANTNVEVLAKNFVLDPGFHLQATGASLYDFASTPFLPNYLRSSTSLALSSNLGKLTVETGATLKVDANGLRNDLTGRKIAPTIALTSLNNQLYVDGTLHAQGGDISLTMDGIPGGPQDSGYSASQAIWLGSSAKLLAGGYTQTIPNRDGLRQGAVYDGGSIHLDAKKGYIVAETGSSLEVSGTSAVLDIANLNQFTPTKINSNGGDITLSAREGMLLDATYLASSPGGLEGSLAVQLTRNGTIPNANPVGAYPGTQPDEAAALPEGFLPNQLWYLNISQAGTFVPNSLNVGDTIDPLASGVAKITANNIKNAGFADVSLLSEHGVRFVGDVDLSSTRSLNLNARVIEATADAQIKLSAPKVVLSNQQTTNILTAATPVEGTANLNVNANLLSLVGQFALSGFGTSNLTSLGDIRLTGLSNLANKGELLTTGNLNFNARQLYPTTLSDFTVSLNGAGNTISFNKLNANDSYDKVQSAGGKLTVNAETINQNGVLLAPFGTINLNATDTLNLNAGSVTSVAAEGSLIPFGLTARGGLEYIYDNGVVFQAFTAPPERQVKLSAPNVNQNADSEVDISGGGDLFAYEWIAGLGGSADVLASGANQNAFGKGTTDTWAIFPANKNTFASFDPQYWQGSTIKAGDAVFISGTSGLAAGYYTLLPARYALLPGAVLVSSVSGFQDRVAGQTQTLANGSTLVSGHLAAYTANGYKQTTRTGGFVVRPGSDANKLAQYNTTTASTFFKDNTQVQQTADAGRLSLAATNSLALNGILVSLSTQGGKGAELDIAAPKLLVVDEGQATGQVTLEGQTYLAVDESTLANFNVTSLLLGGTRSGGKLEVTSSEVRVGNNASVSGPEVTLAATDKISLDNGARVTGVGAGSTAKDLTVGALADENGLGAIDGDGALLRVSGTKTGRIKRINTDSDRGDLLLGLGSVLDGNGALQIDATKNIALTGDLEFGKGAALTLSANRVSLGSPDNNESVSNGLWLKKSQLEQFVDAGSLELNSKSSVDLYGDLAFGNNQFDLTIQGAGLTGYQNSGKVAIINAKTFTLANNENRNFTNSPALTNGTLPALGNGNLNINAETVVLGNNTVRLAGYDQIDITATKETIAQGKTPSDSSGVTPNKLVADNNLTINTPVLTAAQKANYVIEAGAGDLKTGLLKIHGTQGVQPENFSVTSSQGAKLKLTADKVLLAGGVTDPTNTVDRQAANVVLKGGQVTVEATGANATDSVVIENGAGINVQGTAFVLNDQKVDLSAGKVALKSNNGDVEVNAGARIDVSASGTGDAGQFEVSALNGSSKINAVIKAAEPDAKGKNASSNVVAKFINDFGQTVANLATFSGAQSYRAREGDIALAASDKIVAKEVKIEASNGAILVNGTIDASGDKGGNVQIFAKNNATIASGAQILAKGLADKTSIAGNLGDGGNVIIASDAGIVSTAAPVDGIGGTLIDVSGDQQGSIKGQGGNVAFRASRTGAEAGSGVNVSNTSASAVTGADRISVEAVKKYNYTTIGSEQQSTIRADNDTYLASVATLTDFNLTPTIVTDDLYVMNGFSNTRDGKSVIATPGVEINSPGDLTIASNWLLAEKPGVLTLRAGNDLIVNGNIDALGPQATASPQSANAWSYRLVAGADTNSVNPETVIKGVGDINLRNTTAVRTGTGSIAVVAGKDLQLGSEGTAGAAIYTIGEATADPQGFTRFTSIQAREFYGHAGGDVAINLGGNLFGSETAAGRQNVSQWFTHAVLADSNVSNSQVRWWNRDQATTTATFRTGGFTNGVATLGGGDVNINASGDIAHLQVASASNARMGGDINSNPDLANFIEQGGGDVNLHAGGSINKTLLHAGNGSINANAGAFINTDLSIMDTKVNLKATDNLVISNTSNPTVSRPNINSPTLVAQFYTYTDETIINAVSTTGNVDVTGRLPSKLALVAAAGDINANDIVMFPSSTGNATLLAAKNTFINDFVMSDVNPQSLPGITTSNLKSLPISSVALDTINGASGHTPGLLHLNNNEPVRIYAGNDVVFSIEPTEGSVNRRSTAESVVVIPKKVQIQAGHDVLDANLIIQNNKSTDVSVIQAGNSIRYSNTDLNGRTFESNPASVQVAGPGRLHLIANKDIDLGTSNGVLSIGNTSSTFNNPFLPEQGADIFIQPGASAIANYDGILNTYVESQSQFSAIYLPRLTQYMQQRTGNSALTASEALTDFKLLDRQSQTAFINDVFYSELKAGGLDALNLRDSLGDFSRSNRAILTMFPTFAQSQTTQSILAKSGSIMNDFAKIANEEITHPGDLSLFYSQVKSERGGRIELLVPGGFINAGLEVAGGVAKQDSELGIVSLRGGELLGFVRGDFQVNQSRVFTLGGSNLMLYSALEDIDAGRGAKTASSTPPPVIRIVNGQVVFDFSGAVTGSGIAALTSTGGQPGDVDLFAPYGEINAGEAGIRSAGNINLGARVVVGADNISAGGVTTGAPAASTAGLSVAAPAAANAAANNGTQDNQLSNTAKDSSNTQLAAIPSIISVEVISLGDESTPTDKKETSTVKCDDKNIKGCTP
jgi:filamentous hemagglutinin